MRRFAWRHGTGLLLILLLASCKRKPFPDELIPAQPAEFVKSYGGAGDEMARSIVLTSGGHYALAGTTTTLTNGDRDVYLALIDEEGSLLWSKAIGGASTDEGFDLLETSDGGFVVAGYSKSFSPNLAFDVYVAKTDGSGNLQWQSTFGDQTMNNDAAFSIIESKSKDGYILAGGTNGSVLSLGAWLYVAKINYGGDTLWTKTYAGNNAEIGKSLCYDAAGNLVVYGSPDASFPGSDMLVLYLDENGDSLASAVVQGVSNDDAGAVVPDGGPGVLICGTSASFGDPAGDIYLSSLSPSGGAQWVALIGGSMAEHGYGIVKTADQRILIAGDRADSASLFSALLVITDPAGQVVWEKTFSLSEQTRAFCAVESAEAYVAAGARQLADGSMDALVIKIRKP
jgi:hypothetical protein